MKRIEFSLYDCGNIAFLNGTEGMHDTEGNLFKRLASYNFQNIYNIDNLFEYPERLQVLKLMNVETVVLGTTGIYAENLLKVFKAFDKLDYMPKKAIITMGEDYFAKYLHDSVQAVKIMPMAWSDDTPEFYEL